MASLVVTRFSRSSAAFLLSLSLVTTACPAQLLITEFMASNSIVRDEDLETPDWIEIFNAGDQEVNLGGHFLTDDRNELMKWEFPATRLAAGKFLLVFCSGKNRRAAGGELHTSFRLEQRGGDLALIGPDGATFLSAYSSYPEQQANVSYGMSTQSTSTRLLSPGAPARAFVPSSNELGLQWTLPEFDDASWGSGTTAVGYGIPAPDDALVGFDVGAQLLSINTTIYIRVAFDVPDPSAVDVLRLLMRFDDGFAAFLNAQLVASSGAPPALEWNARATRSHAPNTVEETDLSQHIGALKPGRNILAIQGLNITAPNADLFILPEIEAVDVGSVEPGVLLYFTRATPGGPNGAGIAEAAESPRFSLDAGTYVDTQTVEIRTNVPGGTIRFTLDGSVPSEASTPYTGPLQITGPSRLTARVFKEGLLASPPAQATYVIISPTLAGFDSNLPLVVCTTFGRPIGGNCGGGPYTAGHFSLVLPGQDGRAIVAEDPDLTQNAAFRKRGSSTCGNPKFSFNVEIQQEDGGDSIVQLFDWAEDSDFIMYAPNNFDRSLMRNPIAYWMSREVGRWASKTRFVECFFHTGTGPVTNAHYFGVYNFMEKNKRHPLKIDVTEISPRDSAGVDVTGGYILRRDRIGADEVAISGGGYDSLVFVYPQVPTTPQKNYLSNHLNQVIASLNPNVGSQADNPLIDFGQWIDHHILNWYPKNVDAFRLSGYFHKERGRPLAMGPVWDYDRTMGCSDDSRAATPQGFNNDASGDGGTRYFEAGGLGSWYSHLFRNAPPTTDTPWNNAYRARWRELRRGPLRTDRILAQIDAWAAELSEAAPRDAQKWPGNRPTRGNFQGEINHLKNWLAVRADWIDSQFIEKPKLSHPGGIVDRGFTVTLTMNDPATIYYTIDGTDPRGPSNEPAPQAIVYADAIVMSQNTNLFARARFPDGVWSGETKGSYWVDIPPIMITEIMYNPAPPTAEENPQNLFNAGMFEYVEIVNTGSTPLSLDGMRFTKGISLVFDGSAGVLAPGEVLVIPRDHAAFAARYGTEGIRLSAPFIGALAELGEVIALQGSGGEPVFDFRYSQTWHPTTNGQGYSLVNANPRESPAGLGNADRWAASDTINGNPGRVDLSGGEPLHLPGDTNRDGILNVTDAVLTLRFITLGADEDTPCGDGPIDSAGNKVIVDWDGNDVVNLTDGIGPLLYLFLGGAPHVRGVECIPVPGCARGCGG